MARRLESIYYLTLQTNLTFFCVLKEIVGQGVPFVLMQGAALLAEIYPDPVCARWATSTLGSTRES